MSLKVEDSDHLTTDAVPDKPRQQSEIITNDEPRQDQDSKDLRSTENEPENNVVHGNKVNTRQRTTYSSSKPSSKPRKKAPGPSVKSTHATAKVVNVFNSTGIHVGNVNNYNLFSNTSKTKNEKTTKEPVYSTKDFDKILACEELVTKENINLISTHLGEGWRDLGIKLGYSKGQMDHFYADNKVTGLKEVIYQMLLDWTRVKPDDSKICVLAQALWDADQKDVLYRWVQVL